MDRAAGVIAARLRERERLHHDALAGERGVAVHDDRQHRVAFGVAAAIEARLHRAFDDRVHDLQVRRVEGEAQVHRPAARRDVARETLVVLHVARRQRFGRRVVELGEQVLRHLAERVHEDVQAPAVRHADHDLLHALHAGALHELVHRGDEALAAFEREALLTDVLRVEVALESFRGAQALEDVGLLGGVEVGLRTHALEALLPPPLLGRIGDVHVLGADGAAIRFTQRLHDLAQGRLLGGREVGVRGAEHHVHVGLGEVVERGLELGNLRPFLALQRVEVGPARAERAIGRDQRLHVDLLARDGEVGARRLVAEGVRLGALRERLDDRCVRDVACGAAVGGGDILERVEIRAPVVGHRARVVEIGLVELFDVRCIAAEQVRIGAGFLHHRAHLSHRFPAL